MAKQPIGLSGSPVAGWDCKAKESDSAPTRVRLLQQRVFCKTKARHAGALERSPEIAVGANILHEAPAALQTVDLRAAVASPRLGPLIAAGLEP